jgi:hypothetical protein
MTECFLICLREVGDIVAVRVLDHVVIGKELTIFPIVLR